MYENIDSSMFSGATEVEVDGQTYNAARDKDEDGDEFFVLTPAGRLSMAQLEERTVRKHEEPELFDQIEKVLTMADVLVKVDGQAWRVVDFIRDDHAVLVLRTE